MGISIIILSYNRARQVECLLQSLFTQNLNPEKYEIIVSDDASSDPTAEVVAQYQKDYGNIQFIRNPKVGVGVARNAGIKASSNELLLFLADDYILPLGMLTKILSAFERYKPDILKIKIVPPSQSNYLNYANHAYNSFDYNLLLQNSGLQRLNIATDEQIFQIRNFNDSTSCVYTRAVFERTGLYGSYEKGEDTEFSERASRYNFNVLYAPQIYLIHNHSYNWHDFLPYNFQRGKGIFVLIQSSRYSSIFSSPIKIVLYYLKQCFVTPWKIIKSSRNVRDIKYLPIFFLIQVTRSLGIFYYMVKPKNKVIS